VGKALTTLIRAAGSHARKDSAIVPTPRNSIPSRLFPFFAAAVLVAEFLNAPQAHVDALALGFIAVRVAYLGCYLANLAALRSLAWLAGIVCVVALFVAAA
jgi:uncharacterized MAPEG superfamily protein